MVAFPAATPAVLTPCSTPQHHAGREPNHPMVSPRLGATSMYVARTAARSRRGGCHSNRWASPGGRSAAFASRAGAAEAGGKATRQSHITGTPADLPSVRVAGRQEAVATSGPCGETDFEAAIDWLHAKPEQRLINRCGHARFVEPRQALVLPGVREVLPKHRVEHDRG